MSRAGILSLTVCGLWATLTACQLDDLYLYPDADLSGNGGPDAGSLDSGSQRLRLTTGAEVMNLLEGKKLLMDQTHVPSHPNGYDEDLNYGSATQCIHSVEMDVMSGAIAVTTSLATLRDAPHSGDHGSCDRAAPLGSEVAFTTTAVLIENVKDGGDCFDITLTYAGFGQEGRGKISEDQRTVSLELFFRDQAVGHRCQSGAVGAPSVTLNQTPFTGDAVQVYAIQN
ncbi:MAG: hypothetical protein U1E65_34620 [Myxococcota bacterium]